MKLYVGNLSFDTTQESLNAAFARFGTVTDSVVMVDKFSGRSRGFGFVTMSNASEGEAAIQGLNGQPLDGRKITVNEARPKEDRPSRGAGRY
jgi:RNA recognition motif-containing protein